MRKIAFVMGSASDLSVLEKGITLVKEFGVGFEVRVLSAHRTPGEAALFAKNAESDGFGVIIAAAGKAAHLAGAMAAGTIIPVIGVPVKTATGGLDALLSTVQMPAGVPVATVAVDGGENAAILALEIIALTEKEVRNKLLKYREELKSRSLENDSQISAKFKNF